MKVSKYNSCCICCLCFFCRFWAGRTTPAFSHCSPDVVDIVVIAIKHLFNSRTKSNTSPFLGLWPGPDYGFSFSPETFHFYYCATNCCKYLQNIELLPFILLFPFSVVVMGAAGGIKWGINYTKYVVEIIKRLT